MKVIVTGSSGLIGTALVQHLQGDGHEVTRLVRRVPSAGEAQWDPDAGTIDTAALEGHDAVVHLAGVGVADRRWNDEHKRRVRESRVKGTSLLARSLAALDRPPRVLASGSAVGFYGARGDEELTEESRAGGGFLAEVVEAWEGAASPAGDAGIRVVLLRTGVVLSAKGGALKKQLLPFRMGLGGRLGSGRQWLSWITIDDEVAAIVHVLETDDVSGVVNLTAPEPVRNVTFTKALGRALHRPTVLALPASVLRAALGKEMADDILLGGQRVLPTRLAASGYRFRYPQLDEGLAAVLGA